MGARSFNRTVAERGFTRFLILRPSGANCPAALSEALREHWDAVVEVTNPLQALAELCVMTRAEQPRRNWGLPAQQRLALIIVKQSAFHDLAPLQRVLRDGLHEVSVWVDTGEMYLEISDPTHKAHAEQPGLKLAGDWADDDVADPPAAPPEVTPEELDILLNPKNDQEPKP